MAGSLIPVFNKRDFTFTATTTVGLVAAKAIPVDDYTEGTLLVRVHSGTLTGSNTIVLKVRSTAPTAEDPAVDFVVTASDLAVATVSSTATTGTLLRTPFTAGFGGYVRVEVWANYPSGTSCTAVLSAELSVKA
jgi:hypothetical protein